MLNRKFLPWVLSPMLGLLSACSSFSPFMKHSDPLSPEQHIQLGASYEAQGLRDAAGRQYEAALRLENEFIPAHIARGNLAFSEGDLEKAEACYLRVLRLDSGHAGANNNLAMVTLTRGDDLEKAEKYAEEALIQGGPLRPYVLETLASIYIEQARFEEAKEVLEEAEKSASSVDKDLCQQIDKTRKRLVLIQY